MSRTEQSAEVTAYLRQLDAALVGVPDVTAREIKAGVAEELASLTPDQARERIAQLGDPTFIASEARAEVVTPPAKPALSSRAYIIGASLTLAFGGIIMPIAGWIFGYVLVCLSAAWQRWEKVVAIVVPLGGAVLVSGYFMIAELMPRGDVASEQPLNPLTPVGIWNGAVVFVIANIGVGIWLLIRGLRRS